jgi:hypothetical protein
MKIEKIISVIILLFSISFRVNPAVGESAVITLVFPYGARSTGMSECGTALTDNEAVLYYNPAGLAVKNNAWQNGLVSSFYEQLLPEFHIKDLWHSCVSINFQPKNLSLGGFGFFKNHINMGKNTLVDPWGREGKSRNSTEDVFALGWGFNFNKLGISNNNFGLTLKYINSRLAPDMKDGQGTGQTFAIDFGYLLTSRAGLRLGFTAMNMGPDIFYVDHNNPDPLPFTINLAVAYENRFFYNKIINISIAAETRCDREIVRNTFEGKPDPFYKALSTDIRDKSFKENIQECNLHTGFEFGLMNTGFYRQGFLIDRLGQRFERTFGLGLRLFNHLNFDYSIIYSPEGYMRKTIWSIDGSGGSSGVRNGQTRFSFTYASLIRPWNKDDLTWWKNR